MAVSTAAYAFDTVKLSEEWQLTGGLRWERFDVDDNSVVVTGVPTPLSRVDQKPSWRAGGVYKPKPNGSLYAGFATAFNPSAEGLALTTSTVNLEPETTETFEAGTKWDVMRERISLNGAVFHTVKNNARTPGINPGDPPTVLAGEQIVSGIELGVSGRINRRWTGIVNYSFMHSDIPRSNTVAEIDQSLQLTPENTFYLWTTFDVWRSLRLGGGAQYMDSVFRNAINTLDVPSYWLLSSLVSYDVNAHLTLRLNGNNLSNAEYVDRTSGGHYSPGSGRALVASTNVRFCGPHESCCCRLRGSSVRLGWCVARERRGLGVPRTAERLTAGRQAVRAAEPVDPRAIQQPGVGDLILTALASSVFVSAALPLVFPPLFNRCQEARRSVIVDGDLADRRLGHRIGRSLATLFLSAPESKTAAALCRRPGVHSVKLPAATWCCKSTRPTHHSGR